ncbi:GGDEF domain-containing response regulator [Dictyobacter arantiisoli]|uniref:Diguanylate cyclase response regulator n=1 Tax=Dictyobacter arantiisoli TaxID=2014874 RepID=A0A5A5TKF4_9CHLR|nr:response regulator [Dictyobacter arantiisoli]GCF11513.1 diguanylate cyclase response regulator [Dictyobacter arantiisoli]
MSSILVVEDEGVITQLVRKNFGAEGYQVVRVAGGDDAVQFAMREMPGLAILDVARSGIDGYRVIQQLRDHPKCMHIPIIMISNGTSLADKVRAYELGVDSYLTKPVNDDELLAHIGRQLRRMQQNTLSPLTRLPGGLQLERAIDYKLRGSDPWCVLYLDLDNFKAFNDAYGFVIGNDMILLVGQTCQNVVYEYGNADDFVGHVGGDDFVIVTTPDREKILCNHILERYREESRAFYRREDLERGAINGLDRSGHPRLFPLVSLSIGVVSDKTQCPSMCEVSGLTAEAKRKAKQSSSNVSHVCPDPDWSYASQGSRARSASHLRLVGSGGRSTYTFSDNEALAKFQ